MGKGCKGKGKESFEQKSQRLDAEIAQAAAVQDQEGLLKLWSVKEGHMNSNWSNWRNYDDQQQRNSDYYSKGKGKGKGRMQTESAKIHALRSEIKGLKESARSRSPTVKSGQRGRSTSKGSGKASSKTSSRGSSKGSKGSVKSKSKSKLTKEERATRNRLKKEKKLSKKEDAATPGAPSEPRPTRVCPACFDQTTYVGSVKCFHCKTPFTAPIELVPPSVAPCTPTPTAAEAASRATLKSCQDAAASRIASYADTAKKAVTFAAAPPPPPPPSPPPALALAPPSPVDPTDAEKVLAAEETAKLTSLQARKQAADASRVTFADDPSMMTALDAHVAILEAALKAIMDKRQKELQPHQVSIVLSQRQHELTVALMKVTHLEKTSQEGEAAAVKAAKEVHEGYNKEIAAMQEAQKAADLAFSTQQLAATARNLAEMAAAQLEVRILQQRVTSLQTTAAGITPQPQPLLAAPTPTLTPTPALTPPQLVPTTAVVPIPMTKLPEPPDIEDDDLEKYALAMSVLEHHQIQDYDFPLRYMDTQLCLKVIAKLVGSEVWLQAYPAEPPVAASNLPKRVLGALRVAMTRLAISVEARDKVSADSVADLVNKAAEAAGAVY